MPALLLPTLRRALAASACLLGLLSASAQAGPLSSLFFEGSGNVVVFDASAGTGGWVGQITEFVDPAGPAPSSPPLSLVSLVTFSFDASAGLLNGQFQFTQANDLASFFFGHVTGSFTDPMGALDVGGTLSLTYAIEGGEGSFSYANGFGLSLLSFDPASTALDNYSEQGLISATVPEPASLALVLLSLSTLAALRRRARH